MIDNMNEDTASKLFEAERAVLSDVWGTPQSKEKK